MTQDGDHSRLPGLDGLRAIAVILVIVSHQFGGSPLNPAFNKMGGLGVEIFFVLSGYLITRLLVWEEERRGSISLPRFYARRIFRIFPPLVFYLIILGAADVVGWTDIPRIDFVSCLLFFRNSIPIGSSRDTAHFWSLAIEEQFYLLWPILLIAFKHPKTRILIVSIVICLSPFWRQLNYLLAGGAMNVNSRRTDLMLSPIAIGCLLALLSATPRSCVILGRPWHRGGLMTATFLCLVCLIYLTSLSEVRLVRGFAQTVGCLGIAAIINRTVQGPGSKWTSALEMRPLAWVGRLSYSLYLWQQPFMLSWYAGSLPWFKRFPWNLLVVFCFSVFSYYVIELPSLSVRRRLREVPPGFRRR